MRSRLAVPEQITCLLFLFGGFDPRARAGKVDDGFKAQILPMSRAEFLDTPVFGVGKMTWRDAGTAG